MSIVPEDDYEKYRGKCLVMSKEAVKLDPSLKLVRGYYYCPIWNKKEQHWWTVKTDGEIYDPTRKQFASKGVGEYTEFDGNIECDHCNKKVTEEKAIIEGRYCYCSMLCHGKFIGAIDE